MPPAVSKKASTARGGGRGHGRRRAGHGEEEHDNHERWLVTYADLLTVLLALFIVLFAISALNESKFQQLKYSLAAVFGDGSVGVLDGSPNLNSASDDRIATPPETPNAPDTDDPWLPAVPELNGFLNKDPGDAKGADPENKPVTNPYAPLNGIVIDTGDAQLNGAIKAELDNFEKIKKEIDEHLDDAGLTGAAQYAIDGRGLIVTIVTDALVFPGNSATLLPRGEKLLAAIAPAVAKVPNNIEVDGFTNQVDVSTYPYPSGWELSSARASAVVRYLEAHGLDDRQLSAVGYSDQKPLVDPQDPASVTRNRRVEIVVLSTLPSLAGNALADAAKQQESAAAEPSKASVSGGNSGASSTATSNSGAAGAPASQPAAPPAGQAAHGAKPATQNHAAPGTAGASSSTTTSSAPNPTSPPAPSG